MSRLQSTRGPAVPKATLVEMGGVKVLHRAASDIPGYGHIEEQTHLVDRAGGRSLVITGGLATPLLVRVVRSTPRTRKQPRRNVCEWQDVTHMVADTTHEAHVAYWAREWDLIPEEVSVAA